MKPLDRIGSDQTYHETNLATYDYKNKSTLVNCGCIGPVNTEANAASLQLLLFNKLTLEGFLMVIFPLATLLSHGSRTRLPETPLPLESNRTVIDLSAICCLPIGSWCNCIIIWRRTRPKKRPLCI